MQSVIVSNDKGQREVTFATIDLAKKYLKKVTDTTFYLENDEKIYIETSDGTSYEYLKENDSETYLNDIFHHKFDTNDLNKDKWYQGDNGWYTFSNEEIEWFKLLDEAYTNLPHSELIKLAQSDYQDIIDAYENQTN